MDISNRIKNFFAGGNRARNAASQAPMGADFLRYGNRGFGITPSTWSTVEMSDLARNWKLKNKSYSKNIGRCKKERH